MSRYLVPVVFLASTAWVAWHNQQGGDVLVVPFVDVLFPAAAHDRALMGARSAQILAVVTALLFGITIVEHVRDLRRTS